MTHHSHNHYNSDLQAFLIRRAMPLTGKQALYGLINAVNGTTYDEYSLEIGTPSQWSITATPPMNTTTMLYTIRNGQRVHEKQVWYNRVDFEATMSRNGQPFVALIPVTAVDEGDTGTAFVNDLLEKLNRFYSIVLTEDDLDLDQQLSYTDLPVEKNLTILSTSFAWLGTIPIRLVAQVAGDSSSDSDASYDHQDLEDHLTNYSNPHQVTADQVGSYTIAQIDGLLAQYLKISDYVPGGGGNGSGESDYDHTALEDHLTNYSNPHQVTADQVDAYSKSQIDQMLQGLGGGVGSVDGVEFIGTILVDECSDLDNGQQRLGFNFRLGDNDSVTYPFGDSDEFLKIPGFTKGFVIPTVHSRQKALSFEYDSNTVDDQYFALKAELKGNIFVTQSSDVTLHTELPGALVLNSQVDPNGTITRISIQHPYINDNNRLIQYTSLSRPRYSLSKETSYFQAMSDSPTLTEFMVFSDVYFKLQYNNDAWSLSSPLNYLTIVNQTASTVNVEGIGLKGVMVEMDTNSVNLNTWISGTFANTIVDITTRVGQAIVPMPGMWFSLNALKIQGIPADVGCTFNLGRANVSASSVCDSFGPVGGESDIPILGFVYGVKDAVWPPAIERIIHHSNISYSSDGESTSQYSVFSTEAGAFEGLTSVDILGYYDIGVDSQSCWVYTSDLEESVFHQLDDVALNPISEEGGVTADLGIDRNVIDPQNSRDSMLCRISYRGGTALIILNLNQSGGQ